jgi:putative hydrolase of the HAD superfamily
MKPELIKPEMVIFDYGHTLIYEPRFNRIGGYEAVLNHAVKNPRGVDAGRMAELYHKHIDELSDAAARLDIDMMALNKSRLIYEYLGLEFDLSPVELERIFWDNAGPGSPMPNIERLLEFLSAKNIRSGVISNISFCGENLSERINRLIPCNRFEFIMASCEYLVRKPHKIIFQTALNKAGLSPDKVWFCGDNRRVDIIGAAGAGIFPVWYDSGMDCQYRSERDEIELDCEHLRIHDWLELIDILKKI